MRDGAGDVRPRARPLTWREAADSRLIPGVRRAWALVGRRERKRLRLVALYGVLIAGLDTLALILIYALISLLNKQPVTGIAASAITPSASTPPTATGRR